MPEEASGRSTVNRVLTQVWGGTVALFRWRRFSWVDALVILGLVGIVFATVTTARQWNVPMRPTVEIDLSPWALPKYTFFSLSRGLVAYVFSLAFTLFYGYWAAKDKVAERVLVPLLDILQSVPVLVFMPSLVLTLVLAFPRTNAGLELASILMVFTGQAWNMTFSFYHSVKSVPGDEREVATIYRFSWWERFGEIELPFATMGLVWNSMMSMAGGWFFLMITESFELGDRDFRLPGLGSFMKVAVDADNRPAIVWAILAMIAMITLLDQLLWRPVVVWAQKFRVEEGSDQLAERSWFLDWLRAARILPWLSDLLRQLKGSWFTQKEKNAPSLGVRRVHSAVPTKLVSFVVLVVLVASLLVGAIKLFDLVRQVKAGEWLDIAISGLLTLLRVLASTAIGTLWALPAGLAIGLSPKLSRVLQPIVQIAASFPAPMLFPIAIAVLRFAGVSLGFGSIVLMLLGTQWYILFNVIAGAMAIPSDLREAGRSYRVHGWQLFRDLYFPAVFPYLLTGWITAAGGAWNASIISEYVTHKKEIIFTRGIGALISQVTTEANFPKLAAAAMVMSAMVVTFNRLVWRRLQVLAETRFSLTQ